MIIIVNHWLHYMGYGHCSSMVLFSGKVRCCTVSILLSQSLAATVELFALSRDPIRRFC